MHLFPQNGDFSVTCFVIDITFYFVFDFQKNRTKKRQEMQHCTYFMSTLKLACNDVHERNGYLTLNMMTMTTEGMCHFVEK